VLPPRPKVTLDGEEEEVTLAAVDLRSFGTSDNGEAYRGNNSDDEDGPRGPGGQNVQCQNM